MIDAGAFEFGDGAGFGVIGALDLIWVVHTVQKSVDVKTYDVGNITHAGVRPDNRTGI